MRLPLTLTVAATFALAAILSLAAASLTATVVEDSSQKGVKAALDKAGLEWAEVHAEGLHVFLAGTAPSEAKRFMAMSTAGGIVDAARVIDNMEVVAAEALTPPKFSLEILRNEAGISLIGLIPETEDRKEIVSRLNKIGGATGSVADFMETASYDVPRGWSDALEFGLRALRDLPRSKISVEASSVTVIAMTDSPKERFELEKTLTNKAPSSIDLKLDISAPRPVITPFTLRAAYSDGSMRFDACSADTEKAQRRILAQAKTYGLPDSTDCVIGLGVPSPKWADAATLSLSALAELGGGTVTITDADIALLAAEGTDAALFDKVVAQTEKALPEVFALHATLPVVTETGESSIPEFVATLSPEGLMQMRGKLGTNLSQTTVNGYAQARFGSDKIYDATRLGGPLPSGWDLRVMAGLDALAKLHNGAVTVTPDTLELSGQSGQPDIGTQVSQLLSRKLGKSQQFTLGVAYNELLDPLANIPTPEECLARITATQAETKIAFEPGSGTLDAGAKPIIDAIADIVEECGDLPLEIQGHTDSQGRESMNLALSQNRAQSVLAALRDRRILTGNFVAKGYGEANPIADNGTEEGREANRRIEFVLIQPEAETKSESETTDEESLETTAESGQDSTGAGDGAQQETGASVEN
jgi:OOP family OmpA-OmpF porin